MPATAEQCRQYRQRLKERVREYFGTECVLCGAPATHMAHIEPTGLQGDGRGLTYRYLDMLKHNGCYRPLCKKCHRSSGGPNDKHVPY